MKFPLLITSLLLATPFLANATTDWTPYLKPMQNGCEFPNPTDKLPKIYQSSVIKKTTKGNPKAENDGKGFDTTFHLKNATAFGLPIRAVMYHAGYEDTALLVYFKDNSFTQLRPTFKLPVSTDAGYEYTIEENNAEGYSVQVGGYSDLIFDKKEKSISCALSV